MDRNNKDKARAGETFPPVEVTDPKVARETIPSLSSLGSKSQIQELSMY